MPSTRTTKWVFCYDFHLVCSKFEPVIFGSKSCSKASVKKPASKILTEEVSTSCTHLVSFFFLFVLIYFKRWAKFATVHILSKLGTSAMPLSPVTVKCLCLFEFSFQCQSSDFFFCSEILETPTKHKKTKMAERPSPGSPEFEDLPPVTISYVFLPSFLWINNFHDVVVIRPGR